MDDTNPIPKPVRGWLQVVGVIVGALGGVIAAASVALHLTPEQIAVVTAGVSALLTIISTLARANLRDPGEGVATVTPVDGDEL